MPSLATPPSDARPSRKEVQRQPKVMLQRQAPAGLLVPASPMPACTPLPSAAAQGTVLVQTPIKTLRVPAGSSGKATAVVNGFVEKHPWVQRHPCGIQVRNTFIDYKVAAAGAPWSEPRSSRGPSGTPEGAAGWSPSPTGAGRAACGLPAAASPTAAQPLGSAGARELSCARPAPAEDLRERLAEAQTGGAPAVQRQEPEEPEVLLPDTPAAHFAATPTSSICKGFAATPSSIGSARRANVFAPVLPGQPPVAAPTVLRLSSYLPSPKPGRPVLRLAETLGPPPPPRVPSLSASAALTGTVVPSLHGKVALQLLNGADEVQPRRLWFT